MMKLGAFLGLLVFSQISVIVSADYQIGVGRADCTGPTTEIIFTGYANLGQVGCGLHLRQFSRAFIVDDGTNRVVFVTVDSQSITHGVRREVLKRLSELYNDTYSEENLLLSGTHTHGTPGGWMMDLMFDVITLGFVEDSFLFLVEGITQSIINAHENIVTGKIYLNSGTLLDANINRSPAAYLYNPTAERAKYEYNVDKEMVQLKFVRSSDNLPIGAVNWFAVHPTSMNNTNCLVTSDNVGYAAIQLENHAEPDSLPGMGDFVGAFASSNLGDVSPNIKGPICIDTGEQCDFVTSTCDGNSATCIAFGPGDTMQESTQIIATRLAQKSIELFEETGTAEVTGPVKHIHQFVHMPSAVSTITLENGTEQEIRGCYPAMGYSFAGGTTDGPGLFGFEQGNLTDNALWNAIRDFIFPPSDAQIACHLPKPILVNTGEINFPYSWQPTIVTTHLLTIGNVALIGVPGEFTTMSGRRMRDAVRDTIIANGGAEDTRAVIAGLSNVYTDYIATFEEYQLQRYEAASTAYGPHTLNIYINKFKELATALMTDATLDPGPTPADFSSQLISLVTAAGVDGTAEGQNFGDCIQQPPETATSGDTVTVKFASGNPRHDSLHGDSFFSVERSEGDDWVAVATDAVWETRMHWLRTNDTTGENELTIEWDIGANVAVGQYRIRHKGHHKTESFELVPYEGLSQTFDVV